ncbi:cupin domain-containing protein [Antarcticibacterium arcticum]|uniref:Cupin domain-containing protein n=1 Tax=Antarcticibacterium arcticum TaxID=2585771 RepID=A0A5B8YG71_9FLAO|nr:cupin domain-containing protein [Antarcticibacterium arcticum]QED36925.1 cupin domain-containing protein [Antarcticibacterium arcticum]
MKAFSNILNLKTILFSISLLISINLVAQEENSLVKIAQDPTLEWGPCPDFMPEGCKLTVLHGDPARKNSDIFIQFPANSEIPNHYHTSAERMVLIEGELEVTYEGEEKQTMKAGSYAYGPALKHHTGRCGDAPCVLFIAFEEAVDAIAVKD